MSRIPPGHEGLVRAVVARIRVHVRRLVATVGAAPARAPLRQGFVRAIAAAPPEGDLSGEAEVLDETSSQESPRKQGVDVASAPCVAHSTSGSASASASATA